MVPIRKGAFSIMVSIIGNGIGNPSLNPVQNYKT